MFTKTLVSCSRGTDSLDRELPIVVRACYIYISHAPHSTSNVISLPLLIFRTLFFMRSVYEPFMQ